MLARPYLSLALLLAVPAWCQVAPSATGTDFSAEEDSQMLMPPLVSGVPYPLTAASETQSNHLAGGLTSMTAFDDNVLAGASVHPVSDVAYTLLCTLTGDQTTSRQHRTFTYSPGFTLFQHTSGLNEVDQHAALDDRYQMTDNMAVSFRDAFEQSSSVFNQPYPLLGEGISGSPQPLLTSLVVPFGDRIDNTATGGLSYQFARNAMVGGGGDLAELDYPNPAQVPGLFNSSQLGGSAFGSLRLSEAQYVGETYFYSRILAFPPIAEFKLHTQTFLSFYTLYLNRTFSLSLAAGPQYVYAAQATAAPYQALVPSGMASFGLQGNHADIAASYLRTVTGGGGLVGAFNSNSANTSASWRMTGTWTLGLAGIYAINKNVTALFPSASPGGHSISGAVSVQRSIGEHFSVKAGYLRLHQRYSGLGAISGAPDSDQESVSVSYQFRKSLGK